MRTRGSDSSLSRAIWLSTSRFSNLYCDNRGARFAAAAVYRSLRSSRLFIFRLWMRVPCSNRAVANSLQKLSRLIPRDPKLLKRVILLNLRDHQLELAIRTQLIRTANLSCLGMDIADWPLSVLIRFED